MGDVGGADPPAFVMIMMLTTCAALPGVTGDSATIEACIGKPVTLNVTWLANPFLDGVSVIGIVAVCPAFTATGFAGPAIV